MVAQSCVSYLNLTTAASVQGGGVQLNNARITSEDHEVHRDDLIDGRLLLLAAGKKNKLLLRIK